METGTVIKTRQADFPLIYHYAIVCNPYIIHHPRGTTPQISSYANFFQNRYLDEIIGILDCNEEYLFQKFDEMKNVKFDLVNSNCEDFVNEVIGQKIVSGAKRDLLVVVSTVFIYLIK